MKPIDASFIFNFSSFILKYPPPRIVGCNTESDNTCRTIKANYYKTGRINFQYQNDWGTTGAIVIYETL